MRVILTLLIVSFLIVPTKFIHAQEGNAVLKGIVTDSIQKRGIPNVNVFIPFTSIGTVTNSNGEYTLMNVPFGDIQVGFRHITYSPKTEYISIKDAGKTSLSTTLSVATWQLEEIVKIAELANGKRAYNIFKQYFLGDPLEINCTILNPEVLFFHFENNKLIAKTKEPLLIRNKNLGYHIKYFLDYFEFYYERGDIDDFDGLQYYTYSGQCIFTELEASQRWRQTKWENNRKRLFVGSQRHFYQALFSENLEENGFVMKLAWNSLSDIESYYKSMDKPFNQYDLELDSIQDFIQGEVFPKQIYYQVTGEPLKIKSLYKLEEDHLIFKMHNPFLIFFRPQKDNIDPANNQIALMHLVGGFLDIGPSGHHTVTNGTLHWKYLHNDVFINNFLPTDYSPDNTKTDE